MHLFYQKNITSNKSMFTCLWTSLPCSTSARLSVRLVVSSGIGSRSRLLTSVILCAFWAIDIFIYYVNFIYSEESLDSWVRTKQTESNYINFIHVHVSTMGFLWYLIVITFVEWNMSMSDSSIYFCIMLTIYNKANTKSAWLSNFIKKSHKSL